MDFHVVRIGGFPAHILAHHLCWKSNGHEHIREFCQLDRNRLTTLPLALSQNSIAFVRETPEAVRRIGLPQGKSTAPDVSHVGRRIASAGWSS